MARPRKPDRQKELEGNRSRDPDLEARLQAEPDVPEKVPGVPSWLRSDKVAAEYWRKYVPVLWNNKLLTNADIAAFAVHCQSWSRWREAEKQISATGTVNRPSKNEENTYEQPSAYVSVAGRYYKQWLETGRDFGLTPASRSKLNLGGSEKKKASKMAQVLKINPRAKDAS